MRLPDPADKRCREWRRRTELTPDADSCRTKTRSPGRTGRQSRRRALLDRRVDRHPRADRMEPRPGCCAHGGRPGARSGGSRRRSGGTPSAGTADGHRRRAAERHRRSFRGHGRGGCRVGRRDTRRRVPRVGGCRPDSHGSVEAVRRAAPAPSTSSRSDFVRRSASPTSAERLPAASVSRRQRSSPSSRRRLASCQRSDSSYGSAPSRTSLLGSARSILARWSSQKAASSCWRSVFPSSVPTAPSSCSRRMSACPACRLVSVST